MLCLGLDPKSDLSQLSSIITEARPNSVLSSNESPDGAPALTNGVAAISSKGSGHPAVTTPTLSILLTGCHAILQFVGSKESIPGSLIQSGTCLLCVCVGGGELGVRCDVMAHCRTCGRRGLYGKCGFHGNGSVSGTLSAYPPILHHKGESCRLW